MTAPLSPTEEAAIHALHPTLGGNAGLLTSGVPCRAVLLAVVPLDAKTPAGEDATGLILSVTIVGNPPYQARVGVHVPPAAEHLLVAGRDLPALAIAGGVESIMIDWPAALAEAAGGTPQPVPGGAATVLPGGTEPGSPASPTYEPVEGGELQSSPDLLAVDPDITQPMPLKPGDNRGAVAPATARRDAPTTRPSDEDLTELLALVVEMNAVHQKALEALQDNPDVCADLSVEWQGLFARAGELMSPVQRPTS